MISYFILDQLHQTLSRMMEGPVYYSLFSLHHLSLLLPQNI